MVTPAHVTLELTAGHKTLLTLLKSHRYGLTRAELAQRLRLSDRAVRALVEDLVAGGHVPVIADRTAGTDARYRIARSDEIDLVNAYHHETLSRAMSLHRRAKGLLDAFQSWHQGGNLFTPATPEMTQ